MYFGNAIIFINNRFKDFKGVFLNFPLAFINVNMNKN